MKKLSAILASATVIAMASVPAFAAGINSAEQAVLDKLSEVNTSYNGGFVTNANEMLNQAENYFNTIDMTDAESKEIIADINDAVDYLKSQGASTVKDLNTAQKQELFTYGQKAANVVGVTVSYDKATKTVSATDKNGNAIVSTKVTTDSKGNTTTTSNAIATTGFEHQYTYCSQSYAVTICTFECCETFLREASQYCQYHYCYNVA